MALLFKSDFERGDAWLRAFAEQAPGLEIRLWPEVGRPEDIDYALVWGAPEGMLARLPNLKAIFSIGAGVDHLARDPELPADVPLVRMVEDGLTAGMTEFVVMSVLMHHRFMLDYARQQRETLWREIPQIAAEDRRVGILGLGVLGQAAAEALKPFGFPLAGWSRSPKQLAGIESFHGAEGLPRLLARSDILVNLLPHTPATERILEATAFAALPRGAALISVGRGATVDESALLEALESGQIGAATLDVFHREPLPPEHPFWRHPRVIVTPHAAAMTMPKTATRAVVENIRRLEQGLAPHNLVDLSRGY